MKVISELKYDQLRYVIHLTACHVQTSQLMFVAKTSTSTLPCPVFLLTTPSETCHGCKAKYQLPVSGSGSSSPRPKCPIQGAHHRKSKCWENLDFAESLQHNRESGGLQVWSVGYSQTSMCSFPMALSESIPSRSIQVELDPKIEVRCTRYFGDSWTLIMRIPVDSVAFTTLRMNSSSRTTMDTSSTTPEDLSQAVKTS